MARNKLFVSMMFIALLAGSAAVGLAGLDFVTDQQIKIAIDNASQMVENSDPQDLEEFINLNILARYLLFNTARQSGLEDFVNRPDEAVARNMDKLLRDEKGRITEGAISFTYWLKKPVAMKHVLSKSPATQQAILEFLDKFIPYFDGSYDRSKVDKHLKLQKKTDKLIAKWDKKTGGGDSSFWENEEFKKQYDEIMTEMQALGTNYSELANVQFVDRRPKQLRRLIGELMSDFRDELRQRLLTED